jgi:hypothetical protein
MNKLVSIQVPNSLKATDIFEGVHGPKSDSDRGFWARALDRLIAVQKRRAAAALRRYYENEEDSTPVEPGCKVF